MAKVLKTNTGLPSEAEARKACRSPPGADDEVVQLYIHQKAGSDSRPVRELKGFERLTLKPGETKTVTFPLGPAELGYWSTNAGKWVQHAEVFDVWVSADS